jgi:hypothetical protein
MIITIRNGMEAHSSPLESRREVSYLELVKSEHLNSLLIHNLLFWISTTRVSSLTELNHAQQIQGNFFPLQEAHIHFLLPSNAY